IEIAGSVNSQPFTLAGRGGPLQALPRNAATTLDLAGEIAGNALSLKGQLAQPLDAKGLQLSVSTNGQTLASLGPALGVTLPDLGPYELVATVSDPEGAYHFDALRARLNQSDIAGELILRLDGPRPRLDGHLTSTLLDLADFGEQAGDGAPVGSDDGRLFSDAPLPLHLLAAADGAVRLTADRFVDGNFALQAAALEVSLADGRLDIASFHGGVSGGTLFGTAMIEPSDAGPVWHLDLQARQVVAGDLLRDLFGSAALSGGRSDLTFKLQSQGSSLRAVMAALDGSASLSMTGGRINGDLVNVALAGIFESLTLARGGDGGQVNCAVAQLAVADGIAQSRRIVADLRGATILGGGRIDLRNETIAMRFSPASKRTSLATFAGPFDVVGPL
ncbi:MAG: AsmA family protein, partial [Dongiaceae bacterium]